MGEIPDIDIEDELRTQVGVVAAGGGEIEIIGGGSKRFYGEQIEALPIDVSGHSGIIDYDPAELVITLRAGCKLREVEQVLAARRQMFGFEAPEFAPDATIGGVVASGLAGPRRAYAGGVRDFVLGVKILDGRGETLQFGGRVIKNVAGFDVSRTIVGSLGTLGIILEVSIRVVPMPEVERTLLFEHDKADDHLDWINRLGGEPHPLSASCWYRGVSRIRLSGSEKGVSQAQQQIGGDETDDEWSALGELDLDFFDRALPLTRVALPPATADLLGDLPQLIEWGGARRWISADLDIEELRGRLRDAGGSVCAFRGHAPGVAVFQPLPRAMLKLQRNLKSSFDPAGVFNPGKIYPGL